ncbi:di-trans,poly-cis-decaprenylcistransferase [bacterium]|jgi:undecaprenyl diphosphate synthase|nr:di-trans,poly-cis-decaprenylcistransferase [bacterium]
MIKHLALIMDGNRRWAKTQGFLNVASGHEEGSKTIERVVEFALAHGIKFVSLYTWSLENFNRPEYEKRFLFEMLERKADGFIEKFVKQDVRICFRGDAGFFPKNLIPVIKRLEDETRECKTLELNFLFCYGAQQEIVAAARELARKTKAGVLDPEGIDDHTIRQELWMAGTPDPDLIIRTGGKTRLSNFLLYQSAYSEIYFLDCFWPELTEQHLDKCVKKFETAQQNFGR